MKTELRKQLTGFRKSSTLIALCVVCCLSSSTFASVTYYVDGWLGNNGNDGLATTTLSLGHGPMHNITAALAISLPGDTIQVAPGFYQEANWLPNGQNLVLPSSGTAYIYDADPLVTSSAGDGLPDAWVAWQGLNPFSNVAGSTSGNPWAHGLTNWQLFQHPSVLLADNFSTVRDGIPDWWKIENSLSLNDPSVTADDADYDGYMNLHEYLLTPV